MQAIDRFDVSHGTRLATYATWWIGRRSRCPRGRPPGSLSRTTSRNSACSAGRGPGHGGKHLPGPQELARRTGSSLEHLTHLQTTDPSQPQRRLDDDSD